MVILTLKMVNLTFKVISGYFDLESGQFDLQGGHFDHVNVTQISKKGNFIFYENRKKMKNCYTRFQKKEISDADH